MIKKLILIFVSYLSVHTVAQAGKIYEVFEQYSENRFKHKAMDKVLTSFKQEQLPLTHEQNYNIEYSDNSKNQYNIVLQQYRNEWIEEAHRNLNSLIEIRLNGLNPLKDQLNIALSLCKEEDQDKFNTINQFVLRKIEDLQYILNAYFLDVLPNQDRLDDTSKFSKATNPFGTYARLAKQSDLTDAESYAIKKYLIYSGILKFLEEKELTFASRCH